MIKQFNLLAATHLSLSYSSFMRPGIQNKKADSFFPDTEYLWLHRSLIFLILQRSISIHIFPSSISVEARLSFMTLHSKVAKTEKFDIKSFSIFLFLGSIILFDFSPNLIAHI